MQQGFNITTPQAGFSPHLMANPWPENLIIVGDFLWLVAYILFIVIGFRQRTYGVPLVAIGLNFTWEIIHTLVFPPLNPDGHYNLPHFIIQIFWLLADAVIVYQLLRYGKAQQTIPEFRRLFYPILLFAFTMDYIALRSFHVFFQQKDGSASGVIINWVMSGLFVSMFFARRSHRTGLSYGGAWAKMLGSACIGFSCTYIIVQSGALGPGFFLVFLFFCILVFDLTYVYLLHQAGHHLPILPWLHARSPFASA